MSKLVVLVRHGKAQSRDLGLPDFERKLIGRGERALEAWLPKSRRLLTDEKFETAALWASPAVRTMQTAQIVSKVWRKRIKALPSDPRMIEELWEQDAGALLKLVEDSSCDLIVMCGHNPLIENLCAYLTGNRIEFATGAVAALRLDGGILAGSARLLWFVQGPESRNWKQA